MTNPAVSVALNLAWKLAADEALRASSEFIEPEHLLLGLLGLQKAISTDSVPAIEEQKAIAEEWRDVSKALNLASNDATELRRSIRRRVGNGHYSGPPRPAINRSAASRAIFQQAAELAAGEKEPLVATRHLLLLLLSAQPISTLLLSCGVNPGTTRPRLVAEDSFKITGTDSASNLAQKQDNLPIGGTVAASLDASVSTTAELLDRQRHSTQLAALYELPWCLDNIANMEDLLQKVLERVLMAVAPTGRAAILTVDVDANLLLKAHIPSGSPAVSVTFARKLLADRQAILWQRTEDATVSLQRAGSQSAIYVPLLWNNKALGVMCVDSAAGKDRLTQDDLKFVTCVAHTIAVILANERLQAELRQNSAVMERLLTNFSPKVRSRLLERARTGKLRLGGEKSEVTILLADMRGFTRTTAGMDAEDMGELLNDYFSVLVRSIFEHDGTVDKYLGDAILAVFGSPEADPKHHQRGILAALEMQSAVGELNQQRRKRGLAVCELGIGLHCGVVQHGFVGTADRLEFTVIGDAVNMTSRYCAAAGPGEILISLELHQKVWHLVATQPRRITTKHEGDLPAFCVQEMHTVVKT